MLSVCEIEDGQHKAKMDLTKALSTIFFASWFLWISSDQFVVESKSFPLCGRTEINNGRWINSSAPYHVSWEPEEFEKYFIHGGPGFAVNFTQVWLSYDCSYHRWRNDTLQACAKHTAMKKNESSPLKIAFIGDSGTRGVFNGLTRLLSGSELYGPCSNVVCGNPGLPLSYRNLHQIFHVPFPPHVDLIFMYYKSLLSKGSVAAFKAVIDEKPHAIIFNTGAWDFDHLSRSMKGRVAPHGCDNEAFEAIASARASPEVREALKEITKYANQHQVRLLYRTNHFNRRFGAHCADDKFLAMLQEDEFRNSWDIWDNFNVSRDSWYVVVLMKVQANSSIFHCCYYLSI